MSSATRAAATDAAFMKEMQRVCADELARCVRKLEVQFTEKQAAWTLSVEQSIAKLHREIAAVRDETQEILEATRDDQESVFQLIHDRLSAVEGELADARHKLRDRTQKQPEERQGPPKVDHFNENPGLNTGYPSGIRKLTLEVDINDNAEDGEPLSRSTRSTAKPIDAKEQAAVDELTTRQKLVWGEKMDVTGLEGMNVTAFVLQSCRFHRGDQGIVEQSTGETVKYAELYRCVQRVSAGLRVCGFRASNVLRVCTQSASSFRLLVVTLAVWNLLGIVELEDVTDDDGLDSPEGEDHTERAAMRARNLGVWLVCDSVHQMQRQLARVEWKPERTVILADAGGDSGDNMVVYADLQSSQSDQPIALSRVSSKTVALIVQYAGHDSSESTNFTHFQMIESVERSLSGLSAALMRFGNHRSFILNALPFNHTANLSLGCLPAVVLGVSLLPTTLFTSRGSDQDLTKHFANYEISTVIISPNDLAQLSECRTLRNLQTQALQTVLCVGAPTPTLPRSLKCLAAWKAELSCRRVLSTTAFLGGIFATDDLLVPIRQKSQPSHQELGQPLPNIHCNVSKSAGMRQDSDMYELTVERPFCLLSEEDAVNTGIFVTVFWESNATAEIPQLNVIAARREGDVDTQESSLYPVLPIEELIASHPLVSDVVLLELNPQDPAISDQDTLEPRNEPSLVVFVSLTTGARKYCDDSLVTIRNFVARKVSNDDDEVNFHSFLLVDRVDRDVYGRPIYASLERRLVEEAEDEGG